MKTIDLHTHSTCSDGTYTPEELVKYGKEKGLSAIALTDHDTFDGVEEAKAAGKKYGIEVIGGIEFSTNYEETEIHMVGLFLDKNCSMIEKRLEEIRQNRIERNIQMVEKLNDLGVNITYEQVKEVANGGIVTRAHIANVLVKNGCCQSNNECFDRYIGKNKPAYVKRQVLNYDETISLIAASGGISIMAHPLLYKLSSARLEKVVSDMAAKGLRGIEVYYSTHSPSDTKYIKTLALKNRLLFSGGSDFHGKNKPKLDLGTGYGELAVPYEILDKMKGAL